MNKLRHNSTRLMTTLIAIPILALFTAGNGYAFTDMNDSAAQADVLKSLQKRIDSLEVRFEKEQILRNEARKSALDWDRGVFAGGTVGLLSMPDFFTGYMFNIKRKNGTHFMICPLLRVGNSDTYGYESYRYGSGLQLTLGLQKTIPIVDRVSYSVGASVLSILHNPDSHLHANAFGGGVDGSINFWFTEKSSLGLGIAIKSYFTKPDNVSWVQSVRDSKYNYSIGESFHIVYTQHFLKHRGKSRM